MSPIEAKEYGIIDHIIGGEDAVFKVKGSNKRFPAINVRPCCGGLEGRMQQQSKGRLGGPGAGAAAAGGARLVAPVRAGLPAAGARLDRSNPAPGPLPWRAPGLKNQLQFTSRNLQHKCEDPGLTSHPPPLPPPSPGGDRDRSL
jgi:hypothetical protein